MGVEVHVQGDIGRRPDLAAVGAEQPAAGGAELAEHRTCHRLGLVECVRRRLGRERREQGFAGGVPAEPAPGADEHELAEPPGARAGPRASAPASRLRLRSARAGGRRGLELCQRARSARRPRRPFSHPAFDMSPRLPSVACERLGMMRARPTTARAQEHRHGRQAEAASEEGRPTRTGEPLQQAPLRPPHCMQRRGQPGDDVPVSGAGWLARAGEGHQGAHLSCRGRPRLEAGRSCEMTMRWGWLARPWSVPDRSCVGPSAVPSIGWLPALRCGRHRPQPPVAVFSMPSGMSVMSAVVTAAAASFLVVI